MEAEPVVEQFETIYITSCNDCSWNSPIHYTLENARNEGIDHQIQNPGHTPVIEKHETK